MHAFDPTLSDWHACKDRLEGRKSDQMNLASASIASERELLKAIVLHHGIQNRVGVFGFIIRGYLDLAFWAVELSCALDSG